MTDHPTNAAQAAQAAQEPVAFVPVHPRNGPLWSDTYAAASFSERSPNYPRMALYAGPVSPSSAGSAAALLGKYADWIQDIYGDLPSDRPPGPPRQLLLEMHADIKRLIDEPQASSADSRDVHNRPETPKWERRWPHDQPNGWNLDADKFLALVKSADGMMWLALGRAKYLELRVDTRDCGFNLYDRDGKPLNPDEVVEAIEKVKRDYGITAQPQAASEPQHDHRVFFACVCCMEHEPESGVSCWSDIGVMPDGTWLCDNCYSDCDKTAYGMVPCDVDDFEFPRFEDLPRPALYPVTRPEHRAPSASSPAEAAPSQRLPE